jgi:uncharacterized protein
MPVLLMMYPQDSPERLTSISLAVVFFNALSGSEAYARMRRIDYKSGLLFALATIPGAIIGALHTASIPRQGFNVIFGFLLVAVGAFLILRSNWEKAISHKEISSYKIERHLVEADGVYFDYSYNPFVGIILSFFVGYISSFLGIGGGIIHVPGLVYFLHFPVHIATATSHFILAVMALAGTIVHIMTGTFSHGVHRTIALAIGVLLGAQLGARWSNKIQGNWIIRSLGVALGLVGVRILIMVLESSHGIFHVFHIRW